MLRRLGLAAALGLVLAGCGAVPQPEVTFYADGEAVVAHPQILCSLAPVQCAEDPDAAVTLAIRPGMPVQISVPKEVSGEVWGVVFSYEDRDGERVDGSSRVFAGDSARSAYTLELPHDDDRLVQAVVQRLAILKNGAGQDDSLVPTGYWILDVVDPTA